MDKKTPDFLRHALSKSQKLLFEDARKEKETNTYLANVQNNSAHVIPRQGVIQMNGSTNRKSSTVFKGNSTGLHLCNGKGDAYKSSVTNNIGDAASLRNGGVGLGKEIYRNEKLTRRPLRPDAVTGNQSEMENSEDEGKERFAICPNCGHLSKDYRICDFDSCRKALPEIPNFYFKKEEVRLSKPNPNSNHSSKVVCPNCGGLSHNYKVCDKCHEPLPDNRCFWKKSNETSRLIKKNDSKLSKQQFYGQKLEEQSYNNNCNKGNNIRSTNLKRISTKKLAAEPECLTISSDEELGEGSKNNISSTTNNDEKITATKKRKMAAGDDSNEAEEAVMPSKPTHATPKSPNLPSVSHSSLPEEILVACRTVRIGSFKTKVTSPLKISTHGISFQIPAYEDEVMQVTIGPKDLVRVLASFDPSLPVFFLFTTPGFGGFVRNRLNMNLKSGPYYDPGSSDDSKKRIVLLPETVNEEEKRAICNMLRSFSAEPLLHEIDMKVANDLLVRSVSVEISNVCHLVTRSATARYVSGENTEARRETNVIYSTSATPTVAKKLMTYPPPPQTGGITITTDDYSCLDESQFLNDVIIDFYLKYLVQNILSETDQKRTHIFSSFFFRRLTQKPTRKNAHTESPKLSPAENRHNRVKTWTRHVDIFDKDYIIIPINESSHWFLAVICFPYLDGPVPYDDVTHEFKDDQSDSSDDLTNTTCSSVVSNTSFDKSSFNLNNSSLQLISKTYQDSCDEAEAEEFFVNRTPNKIDYPIKQPCILVFDSLGSNGRSRIVSILREYLQIEWEVRKKTKRSFDRELMKGGYPDVPQQSNYSDCGIYVLQYVESFFEKPIKNYKLPLRELKDWFTDEYVSQKRQKLKDLICDLALKQNGDNASMDENPIETTELSSS